MRHLRLPLRPLLLTAALVLVSALLPGGRPAGALAEPAGAPAAAATAATAPTARATPAQPGPAQVVHLRLQSILHPVAKQYLVDGIAEADRAGATLVIVELDTPGGLLSSTREISTAMLGAATPVVVYVSPSGAQAASAGFFLLMAADFAAMAPGTNTGAAHPVGGQGETIEGVMGTKVEQDAAATIRALAGRHGRNIALAEEAVVKSRSFTDQEALSQGLVEVVAPDLAQLLVALEGRSWDKAGRKGTLALGGARIADVEMPRLQRLLAALVHPNIAYLLMSIGFLGIYFELAHPGAVLPGVVGGIALVLGLYAMSVLPVNLAGVGLILLALVFFVAEIKVTELRPARRGRYHRARARLAVAVSRPRSGVAPVARAHRCDRRHGGAGRRLSRRSRRPRPTLAGRSGQRRAGRRDRPGDRRSRSDRPGLRARRDLERRRGGSGPDGPERAGRRRRRAAPPGAARGKEQLMPPQFAAFPIILIVVVFGISLLRLWIKVLKEYERGVVFRLGRVLAEPKGPGLIFLFWPLDRMVTIPLRTVVLDVPPQDVITRDNVSVKVNAVLYFRVVDPVRAVISVENYLYATSQLAQTTLRSVLGQAELDELLSERDKLNERLQEIIDRHTDPWGIKISMVEVKHVDLPQEMQRAMARQAEAEREKRAKFIHAAGRARRLEGARRGGELDLAESGHPAAALSADAHRDRRREQLDDHLPVADRAAEVVLPQFGTEQVTGSLKSESGGRRGIERIARAELLRGRAHQPAGTDRLRGAVDQHRGGFPVRRLDRARRQLGRASAGVDHRRRGGRRRAAARAVVLLQRQGGRFENRRGRGSRHDSGDCAPPATSTSARRPDATANRDAAPAVTDAAAAEERATETMRENLDATMAANRTIPAPAATPPATAPPAGTRITTPPKPAPSTAAAKPAAPAAKEPATAKPAVTGKTFVQVYSSNNGTRAKEIVAQLRKAGFPVAIAETAKAGGTNYRVRVGPYAERTKADAAATKLRRDFRLETWVTDSP